MRIRYTGIAVMSGNSNRFPHISLVGNFSKFLTYIYMVILYFVIQVRQKVDEDSSQG